MSNSPPGPTGRPMFGSSHRYAEDPFAFITDLEEAYGGLAQFDLGPIGVYVLTEPSAIERVLVSEADRYRKPDFGNDAVRDLLGEGLLLSEGETWQRQRELARPAFRMDRLAGMADRITGHAEAMTADWSADSVIDVESEMARVTLRVILDLMLGVDLPEHRIDTIEAQLQPLGERFEPDPLRYATPQWLPLPGDREFERAVTTLEAVIDDIVAERRGSVSGADPTTGSDGGQAPDSTEEGPMDLLSILLRAQDRGEQSAEQLRDEMMTMLLAGHDTTALALTYTFFLLSEHPAVERRVQAEVDAVVGDDVPSVSHVGDLEYVEWVIQESMRLYPPVFAIYRTPTAPVDLAGYRVPEDAVIMLPQWGVHRSARLWEDPDDFDPERFRPERRADRPRFAYFPFGGGPRHCIGKHLAMLEAQIILATVVSDYRLQFTGTTPLEFLPSLTMHPRQEMRMRVRER